MIRRVLMTMLILASGDAITRGEEPAAALKVPAKEVPIPNTISAELKKFVERPVAPSWNLPKATEDLKKLQQQANSQGEKIATAIATALGTKVTPTEIGGVKCYDVVPKQIAPKKEPFLMVHVHGGAFIFNGGMAATTEAILLAQACQMRVISIDYRMPPDHPYPAASDDVVAVWKSILRDRDPKTIVMAGTSAGGGLILTTMLRCKTENLVMPAALFLGTPGVDQTKTGDSVYLNAEVDRLLGRYEGWIEECVKLYAAGKDLRDPMISPIYGDLSNLPPTILISGTRDLLLSATVRTHRKLRAANVSAELHVYEGMSHADYLTAVNSPEGQDAFREISLFFDRHLIR